MNPNDELSSERANRIADAVESIERNVSRLREVQSLNLEEYKSSANRELRDATERKFEKLIEAVLDIAESILKQEGIDVPSRRKATIESVETAGVIDTGLADRLREVGTVDRVLLVRLNPAVEHKTRGNAAVAVHTDLAPDRALALARDRLALAETDDPRTNPGAVVAPGDPAAVPERVAAFAEVKREVDGGEDA